jgi:Protein of unknown function (DUF3443)
VRKLGFLLVLATVSLLAACGGGSNNSIGTVTAVSVSCSPSTVTSGQTSQCSATVTGTGNFVSTVNWSASAGTISGSGLLTAPTVTSATTVTVTAASIQNSGISGNASVTVNPAASTITSVIVSCSPPTVVSGQTSQCAATVNGTGTISTGVNWSTSAGMISSSGLLTAQTVTTLSADTVTATSTQDNTQAGTTTIIVSPTQLASNEQPILVDAGPDPAVFTSANVGFVSVTICVPGSTTQCQTIDHVTVDTGSSGLRIISEALTLALPAENDSSGNPLGECLVFADGFVWGPVVTADITVAGETASAVPVQIMIPASSSPPVPGNCSSQSPMGGNGNEGVSVDAFGAKALIGVGLFMQDCGPACTNLGNNSPPDFYYDCPSSGCTPTFVTTAQQVPNPVGMFAADNTGVLIQLPSVPDGGSPTVFGSLIYGIGTESNNGLGTATVYVVPDTGNNAGSIISEFLGQSYPQSVIDSGSNAYFFLDSAITGIPTCSGSLSQWYCPTTSPDNLTASNQGQNTSGPVGTPVPVDFSIEDTTTLFNTSNTAFSTLGGPSATTCGGSNPVCLFDWGLAFFYGKNVFTGLENVGNPVGPYFAY